MDEATIKEKFDAFLKKSNLEPHHKVKVMGKDIDVPVKYLDGSVFMIFFPISFKKAKDLLQSNRLTPVRLMGDRCVLGITIFEYRDSPVGPYNEFTFSIPVMIDSKFHAPILPIVFDSFFKNFGYYVILLGADTDIARKHIDEIFPYPTFNKNVSISLNEKNGRLFAGIKDEKEEIASFDFILPGSYTFAEKKYNTYYKKNNKIYRVKLDTFLYWRQMFRMKDLRFSLGDHEISAMLKGLHISSKPLLGIHYKKTIEIASAPEEI